MSKAERIGSETDLEAIDKVRETHVVALNAGDAEAWVAQFTDDGVQMPPNAPANVGRTMIGSWSRAFLDQFRLQFSLAVDEVRVLGPAALLLHRKSAYLPHHLKAYPAKRSARIAHAEAIDPAQNHRPDLLQHISELECFARVTRQRSQKKEQEG
jgi:uncharacterized protein (TIGR02246 family)